MGSLLQGLKISDVDPSALQFYGPSPMQYGKGFRYGLAFGAYHAGKLPVGIAGGYLIALTRHNALALNELKNEAR